MKATLVTYWRSLASGSRNTMLNRLLLMLLTPPAVVYALVQRLRAALFRTGLLTARRLPLPVVSIGNITVGGTGKTPVVAYIAHLLMEQGYRVAVLSRGYGGSLEGNSAVVSDGRKIFLRAEECGDEPYLLASTIPGLAVVIGADRYRAGCLAIEQLKTDIFLLDDGFQHLRLQRDLNILLLDYRKPFGNGWTLPAGLLREPPSAVQRADMVIRTRCPAGTAAPSLAGKPTLASRHELADAVPFSGGGPVPLSSLRGSRVLAFAGIAEPECFFEGLRTQGIEPARTIAFPDHASYSGDHISTIARSRGESGASLLLTTEKDGVKLQGLPEDLAAVLFVVRLKLVFEDPELLTGALRNLLHY